MIQEVICRECKKIIPTDELVLYGRKRKDGTCGFQKFCRKCRAKNARRWRKKSRFKQALIDSREKAKQRDYVACTATAEKIEAAFTGFCHNPKCRIPEEECNQRLHLDHCHETGEFRGWLCGGCNKGAGYLRNSPEVISGLAKYIERSQVKIQ